MGVKFLRPYMQVVHYCTYVSVPRVSVKPVHHSWVATLMRIVVRPILLILQHGMVLAHWGTGSLSFWRFLRATLLLNCWLFCYFGIVVALQTGFPSWCLFPWCTILQLKFWFCAPIATCSTLRFLLQFHLWESEGQAEHINALQWALHYSPNPSTILPGRNQLGR